MQKSQLHLITDYFDKYYANVQSVVDKRDREFALVYTRDLSPSFMVREKDEKAFKELLDKATDSTNFFTIFLKKEVESIEVFKNSREFCSPKEPEEKKVDEVD